MRANKAANFSRKNAALTEKIKELWAEVSTGCIDEDKDYINRKFSEVVYTLSGLSVLIAASEFDDSWKNRVGEDVREEGMKE